MLITPARTDLYGAEPLRKERLRRPQTSHPRLREDEDEVASVISEHSATDIVVDLERAESIKSLSPTPIFIPPVPKTFQPNSKMLILATQKRLASIRPSFSRPATAAAKTKRVSRHSRRTKSATSRSETSDDDLNASNATDAEWNWLSEPFDYDADPQAHPEENQLRLKVEPEEKPSRAVKDIHSVEVYKAACRKFGLVPSQLVCRHMAGRELTLRNSYLDAEGAKAVAVGLVVNGSVESVDLDGNVIGARGASYLCEALQENTFISELYISNNRLLTQGINTVCSALAKNETLKVLDISGNGLEDFDAIYVADLLRANFSLRHLYMNHNSLRERGGMILANALGENATLQSLDVSWNHLRRKGAMFMCECLRKNKGLKKLNLSWNGLYLDGSRGLKRSLPENKTLVELNISNNRLNEECIRDIMIGMRRNQGVVCLRIANSPMPLTACITFLDNLMKHPTMTLQEIDMTNQTVDISFMRKYEELRKLKRIRIIHGIISPPYLQLDKGETDSDVFINDDPMVVLMEYMRIQNLRLLDLFSSLDADKSQSLSREEFRTGMLAANIPLSAEALDKLIKNLDADGDGEVDYNELLEGLKAHKKKVARIMAKQKHMRFEDTDIGKVNLKINALLQFRMMYHKINLARTRSEQEAMETTLQEYQDKLSDLSSLKRNMLQAGMQRAKQQALERKTSRIQSPKLTSVVGQVTEKQSKAKLTAKLSTDSFKAPGENKSADSPKQRRRRLGTGARAMSAPVRKK